MTSKGLVYHAGALGDFLTALPAIRVWSRLRGGGPLVLLGRPAYRELAQELFAEAWDASSMRFACLLAGTPSPDALRLLAPIGDALVFAPAAAPVTAGLALVTERLVRQDPFPPSAPVRMHVVDWHLALFSGLDLAETERTPRLFAVGPAAGAERDRGPVALHPGSGAGRKNWPLRRFLALAEALAGAGESVAWVLGPAEVESGLAAAIAQSRPTDPRWSSPTPADLAGLLRGCRLFVGNDSGVAHLAAAAGTPVAVLFGASDPVVWAPRGRAVTVIGDGIGGMEAVRLEDVLDRCRAMLSTSRRTE